MLINQTIDEIGCLNNVNLSQGGREQLVAGLMEAAKGIYNETGTITKGKSERLSPDHILAALHKLNVSSHS